MFLRLLITLPEAILSHSTELGLSPRYPLIGYVQGPFEGFVLGLRIAATSPF